jgi:hypothetical protein
MKAKFLISAILAPARGGQEKWARALFGVRGKPAASYSKNFSPPLLQIKYKPWVPLKFSNSSIIYIFRQFSLSNFDILCHMYPMF